MIVFSIARLKLGFKMSAYACKNISQRCYRRAIEHMTAVFCYEDQMNMHGKNA
jgi:hypothetical protein